MNNDVYSMNKTMEMYCPSLKMKVEAEVIEGYAQNGKGGSPRLALKGLFEGKKTLPKKVDAETFEKYGFNAEQTIAAFHAEQVGEPLPESPLEDAPSTVPSPVEPTNANFSADINYIEDTECDICGIERKDLDITFRHGREVKEFCICAQCSAANCIDCMSEQENEWGNICNRCASLYDADTVGSPSPSGPSSTPEPAEATGSEPSNANFSADANNCQHQFCDTLDFIEGTQDNNTVQVQIMCEKCNSVGKAIQTFEKGATYPFSNDSLVEMEYIKDSFNAESAFDKLEDEVAEEYEEKGMSDKKAHKIGAAVAYTQGVKKYGKKVMTEAAKKGVSAKSLTKNADSQSESLVEQPDWIPEGDGRALGQQNFGINMSPLHAESQPYKKCRTTDCEEIVESGSFTELCHNCQGGWKDWVPEKSRTHPPQNAESFNAGSDYMSKGCGNCKQLKNPSHTYHCIFCDEEICSDCYRFLPYNSCYACIKKKQGAKGAESQDKILVRCFYCGKTENREDEEIEDFGYAVLDDIQKNREGKMECLDCMAKLMGAEFEKYGAESQESMILEACGICDKDFASETLNEHGYCGSCCDTRMAEFDNRIDFSAETDDEGRTAPNECPTCGEIDYMWVNNGSWDCDQCGCLVYDAESTGVSKNAQIAIGLTALGVGLALWKSNDILNLFNKFRGE